MMAKKGIWTECPRCGHKVITTRVPPVVVVCPECGQKFEERGVLVDNTAQYELYQGFAGSQEPLCDARTRAIAAAREELTEALVSIAKTGRPGGHQLADAIRYIMIAAHADQEPVAWVLRGLEYGNSQQE